MNAAETPSSNGEALAARLRLACDAAGEVDALMNMQVRKLASQDVEDLALQGIAVRCIQLAGIVLSVCGNDDDRTLTDMRSVLLGHVLAHEIDEEGGAA